MVRRVEHSPGLGHAHRELWEVVCAEIRDLIIGGVFAPGEPLAEAALAARFAVSRGPVRTALMELERVGLVTAVPRRGMQVATFERTDIDELFDVTFGLERMAARTAAEIATPEQVRRLHELLDDLDAAQHRDGPLGAVEADLVFHRHLMETSGNRRLLDLWLRMSDEIRFVIAVTQRSLPELSSGRASTARSPTQSAAAIPTAPRPPWWRASRRRTPRSGRCRPRRSIRSARRQPRQPSTDRRPVIRASTGARMYKVIWLTKFRPDLPREQVLEWWRGHHGDVAKATPGMLRYVQSHWVSALDPATHQPKGAPYFDGHAEHWFAEQSGVRRGDGEPGVGARPGRRTGRLRLDHAHRCRSSRRP